MTDSNMNEFEVEVGAAYDKALSNGHVLIYDEFGYHFMRWKCKLCGALLAGFMSKNENESYVSGEALTTICSEMEKKG